MSYTYKKPACSLGPKHKWEFVRNGIQRKGTVGFGGGSVSISVKGLYKCACGERRIGAAKMDAPNACLIDYEKAPPSPIGSEPAGGSTP